MSDKLHSNNIAMNIRLYDLSLFCIFIKGDDQEMNIKQIKPIERTTNSIGVANQLLNLIKEGSFKPGERLPSEKELADSFQVSRSSIREALRSLEMMDIIETKAGIGSFVKEIEPTSAFQVHPVPVQFNINALNELLDVRSILESEVAVMVSTCPQRRKCFLELEQILENMEINSRKGKSISELGLLFHERMFEIVGNKILLRIYKLIASLLIKYQVQVWSLYGREQDIELHRKLLEDLKKGDPDLARNSMREHLRKTHEIILKMVKEHEEI